MSKLGEVVYYKTEEAPQRYYPALVTGDAKEREGVLDLAVFTVDKVLFPLDVRHGPRGEAGCWRNEPREEAEKFGMCGRCDHPARSHPEDHGRRCIEPGCGCMAWQQVEESLGGPGGDTVVIVTMPEASARDDLAVAAESSGQASLIEQADIVVAVWPDASYRLVKERDQGSGPGLFVVKGRSSGDAPPIELEAKHFASAFMAQFGKQRQSIDEETMVEWFGAAMLREHFPRARP